MVTLLALAFLAQPADIGATGKHPLLVAPGCIWTASGPAHRESLVRIELEGSARMDAARALAAWAAVADLQFTITREQADLVIREMQPGECGVSALTGAWASDTVVAIRDIGDERTYGKLLHEIGHWLGWYHFQDNSVMYPIMNAQRYIDIGEDDEARAVARYGPALPDKWTVREQLSWNVWRYLGVGQVPLGAKGRYWRWELLCTTNPDPGKTPACPAD
jgi:hypothetical protein